MESHLTVTITDQIAVCCFNRPQAMNAMSEYMLCQLEQALAELAADTAVRAIILTGHGERSFMAGGDISMLVDLDDQGAYQLAGRAQAVCRCLETCVKPTIAAVNGYALGGGCELALACDIRIASYNARFGLPELKIGTIPGFGGTQRLPRLIGQGRALEMIMTADPIDAEEALRIGLVNRLVAQEELLSEAMLLAKRCSRHSAAVLRLAKEALITGLSLPLTEGLHHERRAFAESFCCQDRHEGMQAFLEKRPANFQDC